MNIKCTTSRFANKKEQQQQYQDHIQQNLTCGGNAKQKIRIFTMKERPSSRGYGTQKLKYIVTLDAANIFSGLLDRI